MQKGYWISCYREIYDTAKLAAYAELARPAVRARAVGSLCVVRRYMRRGQASWNGR